MALSNTTKIAMGWIVAVSFGLYSFYLSKQYIESHRYEAMKARERITNAANDPSRTKRKVLAES